jgi:uncharacterized phage protein (TIGR02218 family)
MSWNEFEYSTADGQPVTLYEFSRDDTHFYRYTNADKNIDLGGHVWLQHAISDSGLSIGAGDSMDVTLPATNPVALLFRGIPPSSPVRIRIHRWHVGDTQGEFRTVWIGTVREVKREAIDRARLITASLASTFTRTGLRLTWGRACPYSLYDHNCTVSAQRVGVAAVVTELDGTSITATYPGELPADWFSGGYVEWVIDGVKERRGLRAQEGYKVGLFGGSQGFSVGQAVTLFPGCDRTIATCNNKFNNVLNYGGQPHMPGKSPFEIIKLF